MSSTTGGDDYREGRKIIRPSQFGAALQLRDGGGLSGGGGGGDNVLEARVAKLEAAIEHMQRDLTGLQVDVKTLLGHVSDVRANTATLVERSSHLATREWVWNRGVALFVFLFLTLGALVTYAPRLQAALGVLSSSGTSTGSAGPASR